PSVAVHPDGRQLYIACLDPEGPFGSIVTIDTASNAVVARVRVCIYPGGVAVDPQGAHVFAANPSCDAIWVIDSATNAVSHIVPLPSGSVPYDLDIGPACLRDADCDDNNPCTDDRCDSVTGACIHTNNAAPCSDDGNPCTLDTCSGGTCTHPSNAAPCDDGNACTTTDHCLNGSCVGGPPLDCDDGNPCTVDTCSAAGGCIHTPILSCAL